jgi:hypothetical protein
MPEHHQPDFRSSPLQLMVEHASSQDKILKGETVVGKDENFQNFSIHRCLLVSSSRCCQDNVGRYNSINSF